MKNVLFVCLGNSCRSQMAEGFARHYGTGIVNAASAGLAAATGIAPETRAAMAEKGIDLVDHFPKDFEAAVAARYDVVVNISGYVLPALDGPVVLEWEIEDPYGEPIAFHRQVRDEIDRRVKELIETVARDGILADAEPVGQRIASDVGRRPRLWQRFTKWR